MSISSLSSSTRAPSFSLSLRAFLTFPIRICNPPPAASSVRSCKVTPLIKVSLDDVLNKRHLPPLTLKDFEEWLVFVEGIPQYLYFLLWFKEYESRYANWLAEYGFSYYPTTILSSSAPSSLKSTDINSNSNSNRDDGLAAPTSANINYIPPSPSLALFYTRAKKTFFDPTASPPSPYTLPYRALSTLIPPPPISTHSITPSVPHFNAASRPDLIDINEKWRQACKSLFGSDAHPHPHPKEFAALANHVRNVLKGSLERFAVSACHNVGTRRAWCGLAGGSLIVLIVGVLPTLIALFYAHSRWVRLVGFWGCWLGGTVILSSLHGICMMIYLFGDLRQLRSFELVKPAISNPRAIARARPRLKSLFTRTGEEEDKPCMEERKNFPEQNNNSPAKKADELNKKHVTNSDIHANQHNPELRHHVPHPTSSPTPAFVPPVSSGMPPVVKVGLPIPNRKEMAVNEEKEGSVPDTGYSSRAHPQRPEHGPPLSAVPLQLSTILSTSEDVTSPMNPPTSVSSVSPASSVVDFEKEKTMGVEGFPVHHSSTSFRSDVTDQNLSHDSDSDSSDHGIIVSPAFETAARHDHQDAWMWNSMRGPSTLGESQMKAVDSSVSPRSRVLSAVGSVVQWAASSITGKRVNSTTKSTSEAANSRQVSSKGNAHDHDHVSAPISSNASALATPTSMATVNTSTLTEPIATSRPVSSAGTFGVRSWIGGMMHVVDNQSRRSSLRSPSTARYSRYQQRFGASLIGTTDSSYVDVEHRRISRTSRGFGFDFRFGGRSVPEEGILEETGCLESTSPSAQVRTCPEYLYEMAGSDGLETTSSSPTHAHSQSQAQTIASFYAPPRASILLSDGDIQQNGGPATLADQCTARFIPREYAAEVLPDLESVPRVSLSMSRASEEKESKEEVDMREKNDRTLSRAIISAASNDPATPAPTRRVPAHTPLFQFEGLPGMKFDDDGVDGEDGDENKENIPVVPVVPSEDPSPLSSPRPVRPRPPRLQLQPSVPSRAQVISPALPSSQLSSFIPPAASAAYLRQPANAGAQTAFNPPPPSPSLPLPPPKAKSSKFWFDTCPRHPAVEAKLVEAQAQLERHGQRQTHLYAQSQKLNATMPPLSPMSFSSTSAPSTFHSSPRALTSTLPGTYPYPSLLTIQTHGEGGRQRSWTSKVKHKIQNFAHVGRPPTSPPQVKTPSTRPSSAQLSSNFMFSESDSSSSDWRHRLKSVTSVPAFGPLTRVLSPLVSRGQWEIVVRSAAYAFLGTWLWLGVIISLPILHAHSGSSMHH